MRRHLVVCSLESWDEVWRRNQYLVDGLLRSDPELEVLFVEPSRDPVHDVVSRRRPARGAGLRRHEDSGRLWRYEPTKPLPRMVGGLSDRWLVAGVRRTVARLGWDRPVLWVNDPGWAPLTAAVDWPTLYDVTDDWVLADRPGRSAQRTRENDARLVSDSDAVVVCSPALARSKGARRTVHTIGNAVDVERYLAPVPRPSDLPDGPVALYVGTLHADRLDVGLVARTAARLPAGASFVLIGPDRLSARDSQRLRSTPGVVIAGPRPYEDVPAYLQHASVLVVPHVVDDFTDSLDPIKLYEYGASGRPVVSTPVAGFRELAQRAPRTVRTAGPDGFGEAVREVVEAPWCKAAPLDVPRWTDRVAEMEQVLEPLWTQRSAEEPG